MIIVFIISFYMIFQYVSCKVNAGYGKMQRAEVWFRTIVLFEAIVLILTNALSVLHIMTRAVDFVAWLVITIIFAFLYGKSKKDRDLLSEKSKSASVEFAIRQISFFSSQRLKSSG